MGGINLLRAQARQAFTEQSSGIQAVGALTNTWATSGCSKTDYLGMFRSIKLDLNRLRRSLRRLSPGGSLSVSEMTFHNAEAVTATLEKTRDAIYMVLGRRLDILRKNGERVQVKNLKDIYLKQIVNLKTQVHEIKRQLWKLQNQHRARSEELSVEHPKHSKRRRHSVP